MRFEQNPNFQNPNIQIPVIVILSRAKDLWIIFPALMDSGSEMFRSAQHDIGEQICG
jgi:hypothetical protein